MSTLYGVNYTLYNTGVNGPTESNYTARGAGDARVRCLLDTYEALVTTSNDVVYIGPGPLIAGDIVTGFKISWDALGSSTTLDLGDTASATRYLTGQDSSSAGNSDTISVDGMNYTVGTTSGDTIIQLTLADATATGTIKVCVFYNRA